MPFPRSPQTYSTRVPPQNEAARVPSAGGVRRPPPVPGPERSGPLASMSRWASPVNKPPAMFRIVRVKDFQGFPVSLSSVPRPTPPADGCGRSDRKSRQHSLDAWLTRGLPGRTHQPIRRRLRPNSRRNRSRMLALLNAAAGTRPEIILVTRR